MRMNKNMNHPYVIAMRWAARPDELLSEADLERLGEGFDIPNLCGTRLMTLGHARINVEFVWFDRM